MRSLTIVYSLPDDMDASEITLHPCAKGYSWSDLMQVRDLLTLQVDSLQEHVAPNLYDDAIEEQARLNEKIASLSDQLQDCESELQKERIKFQMTDTTCGVCGCVMELVRPGKHQCRCCELLGEWHQVFGHLSKNADTAGNMINEARWELERQLSTATSRLAAFTSIENSNARCTHIFPNDGETIVTFEEAGILCPYCLVHAFTKEVDGLKKQLAEISAWKESAMSVMAPYQDIAHELEIPLGATIHDNVLPRIIKLKRQLFEAKEREEVDAARIHLFDEEVADLRKQLASLNEVKGICEVCEVAIKHADATAQKCRDAVYKLYTDWQKGGNDCTTEYAEAISDALRVIDKLRIEVAAK